jgi:hypothetical protein
MDYSTGIYGKGGKYVDSPPTHQPAAFLIVLYIKEGLQIKVEGKIRKTVGKY